MHDGPTELLTARYSEDDYFTDLLRVTGHETDETLAQMVIRASAGCPEWMKRFGVRFQSSLRGTLHLSSTNAFFLGGGKALMNSYYAAAERLGIEVLYDAEVVDLELTDDRFKSAFILVNGSPSNDACPQPRSWPLAGSNRISTGFAKSGARPRTTSSSAGRRITRERSSG